MEWISENYNMIITENAQKDIDDYIYTINKNTIYIHRVMPSGLVS